MNLVKLIMDLLTGENLGKLSGVLDTDAETARGAVGAAVPAILSGLAGMAGTEDGARKLSSTLNELATSGLGDMEDMQRMLGSDSGSLVRKGSGLLSSLFGDGLVGNIASAVSQYADLDVSNVKRMLASVLPLVLGQVTSLWKSRGGSPLALSSLFADQKQNIAAAAPSGFSLASIPGLGDISRTVRASGDKVRNSADAATARGKSLFNTLAPLAALLLLAIGLWYLITRRPDVPNQAQRAHEAKPEVRTALKPELPDTPEAPNLAKVTTDLTGVFTSATQALDGIRDAASANATLPKLTDFSSKIDGIRGQIDKLPSAGQTALGAVVTEQIGPLREQTERIMALPNVSAKVTAALSGILTKLAGLNFAQVSQDASKIFNSLTTTLKGVKDADSAIESVPQLEEISGKLDQLKQVQAEMSPGGQSVLAKIVLAARGPLEKLINSVVDQFGVDAAALKPVLDGIVGKLASFAPPSDET